MDSLIPRSIPIEYVIGALATIYFGYSIFRKAAALLIGLAAKGSFRMVTALALFLSGAGLSGFGIGSFRDGPQVEVPEAEMEGRLALSDDEIIRLAERAEDAEQLGKVLHYASLPRMKAVREDRMEVPPADLNNEIEIPLFRQAPWTFSLFGLGLVIAGITAAFLKEGRRPNS